MVQIEEFFSKDFTYAVVGASNNEEKFGFKIVQILKEKKFNVIPINKNELEICSIKVFKSLSEVKSHIDIVDLVVPPKVSLLILEEMKKIGLNKVWFQPNSYDNNCIKFCKDNKIKFLINDCLYKRANEF